MNFVIESTPNKIEIDYDLISQIENNQIKIETTRSGVIIQEDFFGIGDSLLTAQEARNKFLRITNKVRCLADPHMQAMAASMVGHKDIIFIIS